MSRAMLLVPPVQLDAVLSRWSFERGRSCTAPFPASPQPAEPAVPVRSRWYLQVVVAPRLASGPAASAGLPTSPAPVQVPFAQPPSPTAVPPSCAASATFARRACLFLCWRPEIAGCFLTNFRALTPHSNHSSVMQTLFSLVNEDLMNASTQTHTLTQNTTIQSHIPSATASQLQAWCTVAKARCAMPAAAPRHCACCIPRARPLLARIWPAGRERRDGLAQ